MPDCLYVCYLMLHKYEEHFDQHPQQFVLPMDYISEAYHHVTMDNLLCNDPLHMSNTAQAPYSAPLFEGGRGGGTKGKVG